MVGAGSAAETKRRVQPLVALVKATVLRAADLAPGDALEDVINVMHGPHLPRGGYPDIHLHFLL